MQLERLGGRTLGVSLCACALVAAGGCITGRAPAVDFSEASKSYRSEDYPEVYDAWTRHAKLVADVGTVLEMWATLESWDFRQAFVAKYAAAYDLQDGERDALAKSEHDTARSVYEIHLVAQSTTDKWNDLERRNSTWRITLLDGTGAELSPSSIKAEKLPEIYVLEFFPRRTPFTRTYTVRFDRPSHSDGGDPFVGAASGRLVLRIASPIGKVEATWEARR